MKSQVRYLDTTIIRRLLLAAGAVAAAALAIFAASVAGAQPSRPLDPREVDRLQANARQLDADAARATNTPDGQRRVTEALAKQFKVDESLVTRLRNQKMGWGEVGITLALSQELVKQGDFLTQQAAINAILLKRQAGEGWGRIAQDFGLKLGHVISAVKRADNGVQRIEHVKHEKPEKPEKAGRPDRPEPSHRAERPEKPERGR